MVIKMSPFKDAGMTWLWLHGQSI